MLQGSFGYLELGGAPTGTLPNGVTIPSSDFSFDITTGEFTLGYFAYIHSKGIVTLRPYGGFRYLKHELGADLTVVGQTTVNVSRSVDHNWTDFLLGTGLDFHFSPKVSLNNTFDAGFGGSNGTYKFSTALSFLPWKHMSISPNFYYMAIDYENGARGDTDWYLYDADEFGWGVNVLFHF